MKTTVLVSEVKKIKEGTGQKGPWKLYHLIDGNGERFATFNGSLAKEAKDLEGEKVELEFEEDGKGKKFSAISKATSENGDTPPLGTGKYVTGQKPPIEARRMAGLNAANNAPAYVELEVRSLTGRNVTPAMLDEMREKWTRAIFLDNLRMGRAMEDEDIPFG